MQQFSRWSSSKDVTIHFCQVLLGFLCCKDVHWWSNIWKGWSFKIVFGTIHFVDGPLVPLCFCLPNMAIFGWRASSNSAFYPFCVAESLPNTVSLVHFVRLIRIVTSQCQRRCPENWIETKKLHSTEEYLRSQSSSSEVRKCFFVLNDALAINYKIIDLLVIPVRAVVADTVTCMMAVHH